MGLQLHYTASRVFVSDSWAFLLPARRYASAGGSQRVCPSLRLSVTSRYYVKTKKASVMISSPSGNPMILVFWRQISSRHSKGRAGASNKGDVGKISSFLSLSVNISKTVADTAKVTINRRIWAFHWHQDRWPWTAVRSNFGGISRDLANLGAHSG